MATKITINGYNVKAQINTAVNPPTGVDVLILTGAALGTTVKSLEIIAGAENSIITIFRKDSNNNVYGAAKVNLEAQDYLMLWEGFIVIPAGHKLYINADSAAVEAIASVAEWTSA